MKKILFLFVLALLPTLASAANDPAPDASYLILHGESIHKEKFSVMVFEYDTTSCAWIKTEIQENRKRYELLLNPLKAYQVWFQNDSGYTKIVYIDPGDAGMWTTNMNVHFDQESIAFIHMYQICSDQGLGKYHAEFIHSKKQAEAELPATNCDHCMELDDFTSN